MSADERSDSDVEAAADIAPADGVPVDGAPADGVPLGDGEAAAAAEAAAGPGEFDEEDGEDGDDEEADEDEAEPEAPAAPGLRAGRGEARPAPPGEDAVRRAARLPWRMVRVPAARWVTSDVLQQMELAGVLAARAADIDRSNNALVPPETADTAEGLARAELMAGLCPLVVLREVGRRAYAAEDAEGFAGEILVEARPVRDLHLAA
jgi:hypothetical protein